MSEAGSFKDALRLHWDGRLQEAEQLYRQVLDADPGHLESLCNLGVILKATRRLDEAMEHWQRALEIDPHQVALLNNLGNGHKELGRLDDALACYRRALEIQPDSPGIHSNLLFALNYDPRITADELFAEHRRFAERFERPLRPLWQPHDNPRKPARRLKIGYMSGDFRNHAVARFIDPVLAHHDRDRFEITCYSNHGSSDAWTERLKRHGHRWAPVAALTDEKVAETVRGDGVDILVDLSGHTGFNRLLTFARKPAPVQVTWIGYPNTTGLSAMDYRLTDAHFDPPGLFDRYYSERLVRLPVSSCFCPPEPCPDVGTLPASANGYVTFASFSRLYKVSEEMLALWADILAACPGSRLLVLDVKSRDGKERIRAALARRGISGDRIILHGTKPYSEYLELHNRADIGLDTFPFGGGTTTNLGLWMGVPFVSRRGTTTASRIGARLLPHVGLGDLAVGTPEEYVQVAVALARDTKRLNELRTNLRRRMMQSPLIDAKALTATVEDAYRQMWAEWCQSPNRGDPV